MDGRMDGWMDGRMDGWKFPSGLRDTNGLFFLSLFLSFLLFFLRLLLVPIFILDLILNASLEGAGSPERHWNGTGTALERHWNGTGEK